MGTLSATLSFSLGGDAAPQVFVTVTREDVNRQPVRRDFALDAEGDLDISSGDLAWVYDDEAIAQSLDISLSMQTGEWFYDLDEGIDMFGEVLVSSPNLERVREVYRRRILQVPGVVAVTSLDVTFQRSTREATVECEVTTDPSLLNAEARVRA